MCTQFLFTYPLDIHLSLYRSLHKYKVQLARLKADQKEVDVEQKPGRQAKSSSEESDIEFMINQPAGVLESIPSSLESKEFLIQKGRDEFNVSADISLEGI